MSFEEITIDSSFEHLSTFEQISLAICFLRDAPHRLELFSEPVMKQMNIIWQQLRELPPQWSRALCEGIVEEFGRSKNRQNKGV